MHNVTLSDAGWYTCVVSNRYGQIQQSSWIQVVKEKLVDGTESDNTALFAVIIIAFGAFVAVAVVVIGMRWLRQRATRSRPRRLVSEENFYVLSPLNLTNN